MATKPRKKFDDIFSHLDTMPACDKTSSHIATAKTLYAYMHHSVKTRDVIS